MSLRLPGSLSPSRPASASQGAFDALGYEIMAEKAAALGRAGDKAGECLQRLRDCDPDSPERAAFLREAARAVHAWFIQREICGLRRHNDVIREMGIPREVLVRLGAS
jgi:hypothetical protein